jgi:hypothetical protein
LDAAQGQLEEQQANASRFTDLLSSLNLQDIEVGDKMESFEEIESQIRALEGKRE